MFKNHLVALKEADIELLEADLAEREAEEAKRSALASQEGDRSSANLGGKPGKTDPKGKDAKGGAKGKGAATDQDKNVPKSIEIEYDAEVVSEADYILFEKSFSSGKPDANLA